MTITESRRCWKQVAFWVCLIGLALTAVFVCLFRKSIAQLYYATRLSSAGISERDASLYTRRLASCSTESELRSMVVASPEGLSPFGRLNGCAELALAEKDTDEAHSILESLIRNDESDRILAIRGLVASKTYDQKRLFALVNEDRKLLWAVISMHMAYKRTDCLPMLQEYYEAVKKDSPESYEAGKLAAYLNKHAPPTSE